MPPMMRGIFAARRKYCTTMDAIGGGARRPPARRTSHASDHQVGDISCVGSSGWRHLMRQIIRLETSHASDHQVGDISCVGSSGWRA
eukprot:5454880-Pyramimonas_sp.AAC.1